MRFHRVNVTRVGVCEGSLDLNPCVCIFGVAVDPTISRSLPNMIGRRPRCVAVRHEGSVASLRVPQDDFPGCGNRSKIIWVSDLSGPRPQRRNTTTL